MQRSLLAKLLASCRLVAGLQARGWRPNEGKGGKKSETLTSSNPGTRFIITGDKRGMITSRLIDDSCTCHQGEILTRRGLWGAQKGFPNFMEVCSKVG